jgi:hypothetical protein
MDQSPNRILASLSKSIFAKVQPHLKEIELIFGAVISTTDEPITKVYFPHIGVISLVVEMDVGDMIETAMVGRDGVVNGTSALDGKVSLHRGIVQLAGSASVIDPDILRSLAMNNEPLHALLIRHEQVLLSQAQQSAGCNASHTVEARMCRWLLRMRDLNQSDDLTLTQEFLAQMLGVRRTSVSVVAGTLQKAGFIKYRRGKIQMLDIESIRAGSCECYQRVKQNYERLLM